ncbi:hypothetical protein H1C71_014776, partial [Ictidomys tridecemlineatus]
VLAHPSPRAVRAQLAWAGPSHSASPPAGPRVTLVPGAPLSWGGVPHRASSVQAVLVGMASVLLRVCFFLVLAFHRFLIAFFLFMLLLFMGRQCVLDCVD